MVTVWILASMIFAQYVIKNHAATSKNLSMIADTSSGLCLMYFSMFFVKFTPAYLRNTQKSSSYFLILLKLSHVIKSVIFRNDVLLVVSFQTFAQLYVRNRVTPLNFCDFFDFFIKTLQKRNKTIAALESWNEPRISLWLRPCLCLSASLHTRDSPDHHPPKYNLTVCSSSESTPSCPSEWNHSRFVRISVRLSCTIRAVCSAAATSKRNCCCSNGRSPSAQRRHTVHSCSEACGSAEWGLFLQNKTWIRDSFTEIRVLLMYSPSSAFFLSPAFILSNCML